MPSPDAESGSKGIVNVASVPQRSPFRYPGGKTWLIPYIREWLNSFVNRPALLVEPFAGGGIVSLTIAFENLADRVLMVELDEQVASVWQTILGANNEWLANRIRDFDLTKDSVIKELSEGPTSRGEMAFQTILRNRTNHGGIMAPGTGLLHYGENGKGVLSRWYPLTLRKRILAIEAVRHKIDFIHGDGMAVIANSAELDNAAFFIDPPYTAAGKRAGSRLYVHSVIDHDALFEFVAGLQGDFLMTYDNSPELRAMAGLHGFDFEEVPMKNTHNAKMTELLIGRDLDWMRQRNEEEYLMMPLADMEKS